MLGTAAAPHPGIFNVGMVATALAALLGALGLFAGLRALDASLLLSFLTAGSLAMLAVSVAMSGLFPLPNPLRYGFNLILAGVLTPLLGSLALRHAPRIAVAQWIMFAGFTSSVVVLAVALGLGGIANDHNIGLWLRLVALVSFSSIAFLCWVVRHRCVGDRRD